MSVFRRLFNWKKSPQFNEMKRAMRKSLAHANPQFSDKVVFKIGEFHVAIKRNI